ncbi:MAG: NAD(P)/FAD-dependent oxidoreductase [Planctomycetaceae bacterium]|nr:NAD(P)/FAD-dependent oxidoreductase [Planctomycetaceae bacterium]
MQEPFVQTSSTQKPHVVIIGGGFGGLAAARQLRRANLRVTLVDRNNYHLFQPLLYQVATGGLSPSNIASPLRYILRKQANCEVLLAEVVDIDVDRQSVLFSDGQLDYDFLITAAGATHSYFGRDEWESNAPGLKTIEQALDIRRRIYSAFEAAERQSNPELRKALLTFVIVGGGPTGVELSGALAEIARHTLKHDFRHINPEDARIIIVEAAEHVLAHYPPDLCERAAEKIRSRGIEILTHTKVTEVTDEHVKLSGTDGETLLATHTVLWAAGVQANSLGKTIAGKCGVEVDRAGRVPVTQQLSVGSYENVFVIGDLANCPDASGKPLPGLAPVAIQQGEYVARLIEDKVSGRLSKKPFEYKDRGTMATIGRSAAVALVGTKKFCGFFAWTLWLAIHLFQILLFENRMLILIQWIWGYLTYHRSSRIITGGHQPALTKQSGTVPKAPVTANSPS